MLKDGKNKLCIGMKTCVETHVVTTSNQVFSRGKEQSKAEGQLDEMKPLPVSVSSSHILWEKKRVYSDTGG